MATRPTSPSSPPPPPAPRPEPQYPPVTPEQRLQATAIRLWARKQARERGHLMGGWDGRLDPPAYLCSCAACGRRLEVDLSPGKPQLRGDALDGPCPGNPPGEEATPEEAAPEEAAPEEAAPAGPAPDSAALPL